jgi:hypothetical protein
MYGSQREGHDVAQICLNGHEVNATTIRNPSWSKPYCDECGEKTITACPSCEAPIQGYYWGGAVLTSYDVPKHCHQCGKPFPWTESKKAAALELFAEVLDLENEQQEELKRDLDAVAAATPRTEVAALKIKRLIAKAGKEGASMLRDTVVNIGTEIAVRIMTGGKT